MYCIWTCLSFPWPDKSTLNPVLSASSSIVMPPTPCFPLCFGVMSVHLSLCLWDALMKVASQEVFARKGSRGSCLLFRAVMKYLLWMQSWTASRSSHIQRGRERFRKTLHIYRYHKQATHVLQDVPLSTQDCRQQSSAVMFAEHPHVDAIRTWTLHGNEQS